MKNIFSVESKVNIFQLESTFYLVSDPISAVAVCKCCCFGKKEWQVKSGLDHPTKCKKQNIFSQRL